MVFEYAGPPLARQLSDGDTSSESDSYVANDGSVDVSSEQRGSECLDAEFSASGPAESSVEAADEGKFKEIFEPLSCEDLHNEAASCGKIDGLDANEDGEDNAQKGIESSSTLSSTTAEAVTAASYLRAGCWARPAQLASSTDASSPLLRSGHTMVSFPVAVPSHPAPPYACRVAPSNFRSDSMHGDNQQWVTPGSRHICTLRP
jgi:hypothetical protein